MQVEASQASSVQEQFSMGIKTKAQGTAAALVDKLMSGSLEGANQARASQGIGTKLDTVA